MLFPLHLKKKDISLDIKLCAEILGGALLCFLVCMVSKEKSSVILTSSYVISFFLNLTSFKSCLEQFEYDNMTHLCVFNFFLFFGGGMEFNDGFPCCCFLSILDLVAVINFGKQTVISSNLFHLLSIYFRDCNYEW